MEMDVQYPPLLDPEEDNPPEYVSLCNGLLSKNPFERLGANGPDDIARHPW